MKEYLTVASVINTHGINGEVKLVPLCDSEKDLPKIGSFSLSENSPVSLKLVSLRGSKSPYICKFEGIDSFEDAIPLKGKYLFAHRSRIPCPPDRIFIEDIKGLDAADAVTGRVYGVITDVLSEPASDVYVIKTDSGEVLFPAVKEFIDRIEPDKAVYIKPIAGFFD